MTSPSPDSGSTLAAWERYKAREHANRDLYLNKVRCIHQAHLSGPYPNRDAYTAEERVIWMDYYRLSRANWNTYTAELDTLSPSAAPSSGPATTQGPDDDRWPGTSYGDLKPQFTRHPPEIPPWPSN